MSTIRGLSSDAIVPQPGFTATRDEKGGWTGRHSFAIRRTAWVKGSVLGLFEKGTPITSIDPGLSAFWSFCKVSSVEVANEEGDIAMVTALFSGGRETTDAEGDLTEEAEPTYRLTGQLQDAPLSLHPKWAELADIEKAGLGLLIRGQAEYDLPTFKVGQYSAEDETFYAIKDSSGAEIIMSSDNAKAFALRIARGETTYLRPVITWTESKQGSDPLTNAQFNKLGNISEPRGTPPEAAGTRDWMLTSAFQEQTGDLYTTDIEWTLSEKGGHDAFLYDE